MAQAITLLSAATGTGAGTPDAEAKAMTVAII